MDLGNLYRDIVETSLDGIWVFDLDGTTVYANASIAHMLGLSDAELKAMTVFTPLDEPGQAQFAEHLEQVRRGIGNPEDVECQWVRADGSKFWVLVSETLLRDHRGEVWGVLHRVSDYTDRRRVVVELEEHRRRLAEAQKIARVGSWEWDATSDTVTSSAELLSLYGISDPTQKTTMVGYLDLVHEEDRERVEQAIRGGLVEGDSIDYDARLVRPDGSTLWVRSRGVVYRDADGSAIRVAGTDQDITEAKRGEAALHDLLAQNTLLKAMASAANEAETFVDVLGVAQSLLLHHDDWIRGRAFLPTPAAADGLMPLHVTDADRLQDEAHPVRTAFERDLAAQVLGSGGIVWDEETYSATPSLAFPVRLDGEVVAVLVITERFPFVRHQMIESMVEQVSVQLARVAERERAAIQLAKARDAAEQASRQKSEFLATMSHEIRTPLNGVIGLNDLLLRTGLDTQQERLASGVQVAGRALLSVINDVLDFSKIEAGKLELEHVDFEVRAVFDQVASLLSEDARAKGIDLIVSCHPDVPEFLNGDPTKLAQVLTNLGSNAVKFTEQGEVFIRATAEPTEVGTRLCVEVTDTGVGIPEEKQDGIFDAFSQADASTTRRYGGTGLGLAISSEIIRAFHGTITLRSAEGEGSTFAFDAEFHAPVDLEEELPDEASTEALRGRRVLIVDDNAHNRLILAEQTTRWGLQAASASGAAEAMRMMIRSAMKGEPYELVLLDHAMPDIDGVTLGHQVSSDDRVAGVPMLMLTSAPDPDQQRLAAAGIEECMTKPVPTRDLRRAVLRALGEEAAVEQRATLGPQRQPAVRPTQRLLVVEDNAVNQMVALGILETLGYAADTADDGEEAVEAWQRTSYDAILMDVQMPRLDGYAATRAIRSLEEEGRRIPVLAMTAAAIAGEREKCLDAGMDDFLTKPVNPDALAAMLRKWLSGEDQGPGRTATVAEVAANDEVLDHDRLGMLRDLSPGSTDYLDRAIGNFVDNAPGALNAIRTAVARRDPGELTHSAHRLKGSALNLGLPMVGHLAYELEMLGDVGRIDGAKGLLADLSAALDQAITAVLEFQRSYVDGSVNAG